LVESAVSQVGEGGNPQTDAGSSAEMPHKAKSPFLCKNSSIEKGEILKNETQGPTGPKKTFILGLNFRRKDQAGPPAGYPINIEITGKDYTELIVTAGDEGLHQR
jgi:hypothetical protein